MKLSYEIVFEDCSFVDYVIFYFWSYINSLLKIINHSFKFEIFEFLKIIFNIFQLAKFEYTLQVMRERKNSVHSFLSGKELIPTFFTLFSP